MPALTVITAEDLLAGAAATFNIPVPEALLRPGEDKTDKLPEPAVVEIRPLTIGAFQLILKAAKEDAGVIPLLMIRESLVQPRLSLDQIKGMPLGLVEFLIGQIRHISGLTEKKST